MKKFENIGFAVPEILLPKKEIDMGLWACVACDQYTQDNEYWEKAYDLRKNSPSAINLMLPELYLEKPGADDRITEINKTMAKYISENIFAKAFEGLVLVKRKTKKDGPVRTGLVAAIDLEKYDYSKGSGSLVRATEGTVVSRIPARMKIRKNAALEMPHILILIDDPGKTVVEKIAEKSSELPLLYDFELNEGGGHIEGRKIDDEGLINDAAKALEALADPETFEKRYDLPKGTPVLLFAVGDGNHSLASAKAHWEAKKAEGASENDPARYALCEIINIHDSGIIFEPIHRVLFNVDTEAFTDSLCEYYGDKASVVLSKDGTKPLEYEGCFTLPFFAGKKQGAIYLDKSLDTLAVGALAPFLDEYISKHPEASIDYIHGDAETAALGKKKGNIAILLPPMDKGSLFPSVIKNGALPRKTFSMGEAFEKRFYNECRIIR